MTHKQFSFISLLLLCTGLLMPTAARAHPRVAPPGNLVTVQPTNDQKMIINTGYQLWLADAASDKLAQVTTATDEILQVQLSPVGIHVAYVVDTAPDERFRGLALHLLSLADQTVQTISPLQATTPLGRLSEGDHAAEHANRAILDFGRDAFAWTVTQGELEPMGAWVQPYGGAAQRLADSARLLQWSGDGTVLYLVADNGTDLCVAQGPDYQPRLLGQTPPVRTRHRVGRAPALAGCG